jgi:hypothetical protein
MATKKEELTAFNKLKKAFPDTYLTLELTFTQYSTGTKDNIKYHAYVETGNSSDEYSNPLEAVNELINKLGDK